ncbi:12947_t:CDS:2 [Funneliformis caledonium]|uniref:12947_t:CDS:1 n=1 Tax=Funneliformis caledonium TaxID=1117310 RepID=A0A9N8VSW7_9GLOM|nr:12947_t:CDS:2 [Funneliformis caledonium]
MTSSGIQILDNFISKTRQGSNSQYLEWIPYNQFEDVKSISQNEILNVRTAKWKVGPINIRENGRRNGPIIVVLKTLFDWKKSKSELSTTILNQSPDKFLPIYGITKDPSKNEFISVIKYAEKGDLHDYLDSKFPLLGWDKKLSILSSFLQDLKTIHELGLIHKDIHSKNILLSSRDSSQKDHPNGQG